MRKYNITVNEEQAQLIWDAHRHAALLVPSADRRAKRGRP
jgi:hypothetical protein